MMKKAMNRMPTSRRAGLAALGALAVAPWLGGCARTPEPRVIQGRTMGTTWAVRAGELPRGLGADTLRAEVEAVLDDVNAEMSTFRDDSLITRFNRAPPGTVFAVSPHLAAVLDVALAMAADSSGAYDVTVGPLVNVWGFGPEGRRSEPPPAAAVEAARARMGWQRLRFDAAARTLTQDGGIYLDLSSIAKGHAVDRVAEHLLERGLRNALVDIGGDMRSLGQRPDGQRWRIAIERPLPGTREVHTVIGPANLAVATSGSYRNFFAGRGRAYSHIIDPRTAAPVRHEHIAVSVLHPLCVHADALATALTVLGPDEGLALAVARDLPVLFLLREGEHIVTHASPAFARLFG
jgi:thiamine biosynthesis lipoprotein